MFKRIFSFEGRIRRTEYALTFIMYVILVNIINTIIENNPPNSNAEILGVAYIPLLWILIAQGAKRCHDIGNSGWWQLIPFYVLWMIFQDGQEGFNHYGENPKDIQGYKEIHFQNQPNPENYNTQTSSDHAGHPFPIDRKTKLTRAKMNMLFGGLWFIGGSLLTAAEVGYIFWGAILYGGLQLLRGLLSMIATLLSPS